MLSLILWFFLLSMPSRDPSSEAAAVGYSSGNHFKSQRDAAAHLQKASSSFFLNATVTMLNRRTALLRWWPPDSLIHKDIEIVFTPEHSNYKVVMGINEPVGDSVELIDLKPYTRYQLDILSRRDFQLYARLNFSTSVMDSEMALMYRPAGGFPPVRPSEVAIVCVVLCVWAMAVYVFINRWGKIRGLIPYQPQYKMQEPSEEAPCLHCDSQIHQFPLCRKALTFDELLASSGLPPNRKLHKGRRNNSSIYIGPRTYECDGNSDGDWWSSVNQGAIRKTKSAENIFSNPRIIVNRSFDSMSDSGEEEAQLNGDRRESASSRHLLNPPNRKDVRPSSPCSENSLGVPCTYPDVPSTTSPSTSRKPSVNAAAETMIPIFGRAAMVEASRKAFLQALNRKSSRSGGAADTIALATNMGSSSNLAYEPYYTPLVVANSPAIKSHRCTFDHLPRRQHSSTKNSALVELMTENSIPQTTTLFNRMYKRTTSGGGGGRPVIRKTPESGRRKGYSTESSESFRSGAANPNNELQTPFDYHHARVGSFRSRLRKQQPISMPDPPGSSNTSSRQQSETQTNATQSREDPSYNEQLEYNVNNAKVAVTVHECDSSLTPAVSPDDIGEAC